LLESAVKNEVQKKKVKNRSQRLQEVQVQFQRYIASIRGLLYEALSFQYKKIILNAIASAAGVGVMGGALLLLFRYAQALEAGESFVLLGYTLGIAREGQFLVGAAAAVFVMLLIGGGLIFTAKRGAVNLAIDFQFHMMTKVASVYGGNAGGVETWSSEKGVIGDILKIQGGDLKKCARGVRQLLGGLHPLMITLGGVAVLFSLHFTATLLAVAAILFALRFYYLVNINAVRASRRYEELNSPSKRASRSMLQSLAGHPAPEVNREFVLSLPPQGIVQESLRAFRARFISTVQAELVSYVAMAVTIFLLMVYLGRDALNGTIQWATVVTYLLLLRLTVTSMRTLFATLTTISRFYPAIYRLNQFVANSTPSKEAVFLENLSLRLVSDGVSEDENRKLVIKKGEAIAMTSPIAPSRYSIRYFAQVLTGKKSQYQPADVIGQIFVAIPMKAPLSPISFREFLGLPESWSFESLRPYLDAEEIKVLEGFCGEQIDEACSPEKWEALSVDVRRDLVFLAAQVSARPIILIDRKLSDLKKMEKWLQRWKDRFVLIVSPGLGGVAEVETHLVAAADASIVALGSPQWIKENQEEILRLQEARLPQKDKDAGDDDDDEEN
jgi:ABC-type multidrug transport system fused ATPase/permease subunit